MGAGTKEGLADMKAALAAVEGRNSNSNLSWE